MRKAKITLSTILVIAFTAGVFAFKSKNLHRLYLVDSRGSCTVLVPEVTTTPAPDATFYGLFTTVQFGECVYGFYYFDGN